MAKAETLKTYFFLVILILTTFIEIPEKKRCYTSIQIGGLCSAEYRNYVKSITYACKYVNHYVVIQSFTP